MPKFTEENITTNSIIKSKLGTGDCIVCKEKTWFIDYIIESRICSTQCQTKFYRNLISKENYEVFVGYCKKCMNEIYSNDKANGNVYIYQCSKCGCPQMQNELI